MLPDHELGSITSWLSECRRPLLLSHRRPDGDALGSLAAMNLALRALGRDPLVALFDPFPPRYTMLRELAAWHSWEQSREVLTAECDAVVLLDTCSLSQLEPAASFLAAAPRTLVIDHHATRDPLGQRDGDLRVFDETACACAAMLTEWIRSAGLALDRGLSTALLTGIATDTGWFRYSNTDARTMRLAADLLAAGVDGSELYNAIYQQEPAAKLRLVAQLLSSLELRAGDRLAVLRLRAADFERAGADGGMTEDLVNEAARLAGVEATVLFTEEADGLVRVNLRSKRGLDVAEFARRYGGGGHARAAGCRLSGGWERVVPALLAELEEVV